MLDWIRLGPEARIVPSGAMGGVERVQVPVLVLRMYCKGTGDVSNHRFIKVISPTCTR